MTLPNPEIQSNDLIRESREPINENFNYLEDNKANDSEVVHNTGDETINGIKAFNQSPTIPNPTTAEQAANKQYVDQVKVFSIRTFA